MIRLTRCHDASQAGRYFRLHLQTGDSPTRPAAPSYHFRAEWIGPALRDLQLVPYDSPTAAQLTRLGRGLHPSEGRRLAPAINRKRAYYDVTVAAPKTISLGALLIPNHMTAHIVVGAHQKAVEAVAQAVSGMIKPQNPVGPEMKKWLGAVFTHTHSREGDPHLHSHIVLPNLMQNERGEWRAMQVVIAGSNRFKLEMIYAHELARQLRMRELGPELTMNKQGLPEFRCLRALAPRYSQARAAVLSAAKAAELERAAQGKPNVKASQSQMHPRSHLPVPDDRAAIKRRQWLADRLRRVKAKEADDPVRLTDEAQRWCQRLTNQESRTLTHLLDDVDPTNPRRRVHVIESLPPAASALVRAAYRRLPEGLPMTGPTFFRAMVQESAGRHRFEDLHGACRDALRARAERVREIHRLLNEDSEAIAWAQTQSPSPESRSVQPQQITATQLGGERVPTTPAVAPSPRTGRGR